MPAAATPIARGTRGPACTRVAGPISRVAMVRCGSCRTTLKVTKAIPTAARAWLTRQIFSIRTYIAMTMVPRSLCLSIVGGLSGNTQTRGIPGRWTLVSHALGLLLVVLGGCGGGAAPSIHGKVTLDGEAVTQGSIAFLPTGSGGPKAAAAIEQGAYTISSEDKLVPGKYRVE